MFKRFNKFYSPPDSGTGGTPNNTIAPSSKEDMIEFLGDVEGEEIIPLGEPKDKDKDRDKTPPKDETPDDTSNEEEESEEEGEESDELEELELELEEPTEEQLELVTPVRRKEILAKYPSLFKDFPYLEKAYYREQQFTELLPTIDDAKAAVEAKEILSKFEGEILGDGNLATVLQTAKIEAPQSFAKIIDNFFPTLHEIDKDAYFHVMGNLTKQTIMSMVSAAKAKGDNDLAEAAKILHEHVFGTNQWTPPTTLSRNENPQDKEKENRLSEREQAFVRQQFDHTKGELDTRVNNALRATIEANIDPKKSMTDYVRRSASREALEQIEILLSKDTRFKTLVDKLWSKAFEEKFTRESTDRIRSAFVSRAKSLLPAVIKTARNNALRGMGKRVSDSVEEERPERKGPISGGKPRSQSGSGKITKATDIPKGMSTLEFLNSD